jgi:hypothetical protein
MSIEKVGQYTTKFYKILTCVKDPKLCYAFEMTTLNSCGILCRMRRRRRSSLPLSTLES